MPTAHTRLTPLEFAALALYEEGPRHPYEVFQEMTRRREDTLVKVRPGTLYHAINRLAAAGLLTEVGTDRDGNRPERTSYAITAEGANAVADALRVMLARKATEYPEFGLGIAECSMLPPTEVADLLTARADQLRTALEEWAAAEHVVRDRNLPEIFWAEVGWIQAITRADLDWTLTTIKRIRSGDLDWTPRPRPSAAHRQTP